MQVNIHIKIRWLSPLFAFCSMFSMSPNTDTTSSEMNLKPVNFTHILSISAAIVPLCSSPTQRSNVMLCTLPLSITILIFRLYIVPLTRLEKCLKTENLGVFSNIHSQDCRFSVFFSRPGNVSSVGLIYWMLLFCNKKTSKSIYEPYLWPKFNRSVNHQKPNIHYLLINKLMCSNGGVKQNKNKTIHSSEYKL